MSVVSVDRQREFYLAGLRAANDAETEAAGEWPQLTVPWELGLQGMMEPGPADPSVEPEPYYPEYVAKSDTGSNSEGKQLQLFCPSWVQLGECEHGHQVAKELICNREWCDGDGCGGNDGKAHQRRKAAWYPRARQIASMGRFVLTIPPEVRSEYRTRETLGKAGTAVTRMLKRYGFTRGLRRWHLFGEDHHGSDGAGAVSPVYHPHLEVIVDGGYFDLEMIEAIKASWCRILKVDVSRGNIHYEYSTDVRKKCHIVSYALRPTFLHWEWDEDLAREIIGFHNRQTWGKWDGEPVWEIPVNSEAKPPLEELVALHDGRCPIDGSRITWSNEIRPSIEIGKASRWRSVTGGYYILGTRFPTS